MMGVGGKNSLILMGTDGQGSQLEAGHFTELSPRLLCFVAPEDNNNMTLKV